jgi:hypothetical protein
MRSKQFVFLSYVLFLLIVPGICRALDQQQSVCQQDVAYRQLDFWVGRWDVFNTSDGSKAGTSELQKILQGCAIAEEWHEADGSGEIRELFYYQKAKKLWHQVWISDAGPTKERQLIETLKDRSVRFQGEVAQLDGGSHLDRSTVTPLPGDRIHQVIEISRDGGKTWQVTFDAEYRKQK